MTSSTGQRSGKADPKCTDCKGRGVTVETYLDPVQGTQERLETLCRCTDLPDPTTELNDLEQWERETPE